MMGLTQRIHDWRLSWLLCVFLQGQVGVPEERRQHGLDPLAKCTNFIVLTQTHPHARTTEMEQHLAWFH